MWQQKQEMSIFFPERNTPLARRLISGGGAGRRAVVARSLASVASVLSARSGSSVLSGLSSASRGSGLARLSVASGVSGASVGSSGSLRSGRSGGSGAASGRGLSADVSVTSGVSGLSIVSGSSVLSGRSGRSGGSDSARAASVSGLPLLSVNLGGAVRVELGELSSEGSGAGTAVLELVLEGGLHYLHVHAEHGDGDDCRESGDSGDCHSEEGELLHGFDLAIGLRHGFP
ncbi:hypothetical protein PMAYCL1PPCAC_09698, partial [Pristionchus mayeri]